MLSGYKRGEKSGLRELEPKPLPPDWVRLAVRACGICGSELLPPRHDRLEPFGHEIAGVVVETGAAVTGLAIGREAVVESSSACGRCTNCRDARQELCVDLKGFWGQESLGFAETVDAPALSVVPYEGLAPDIACLAEPLGVAIDLARLSSLEPRSNVLLIGPGPIGLMAAAIARRMGVRRLFLSARPSSEARIAWLKDKVGVDGVFDPGQTPLTPELFPCAIDRVMVTAPPRTLPDAMLVAAKGGVISYIGIEYGEGAVVGFDANLFHFKKLQLRGSHAAPALYTPLALQYLRDGVVDGASLISGRFPLTRLVEAMQAARDKGTAIKVVVQP